MSADVFAVNPGDIVACTDCTCGRKFRATKRISADQLAKSACPDCGSPLAVRVESDQQPARQPAPLPPQRSTAGPDTAADDFVSFLDEELSPENSPPHRVAQLFRLEDSGQVLDEGRNRQKRSLIRQCLRDCPTHCPYCGSVIQAGAASCAACGLEFEGGSRPQGRAAEEFRKKYADAFLNKARTKMEEEEERIRQARFEDDIKQSVDLLTAQMIIRSLLGG